MNDSVKKDLAEAREVCPTTSQRLLQEGALLVDVREPAEVAQIGFAGCEVVNIPLSQFQDRWAEVPRDRDVIVACAVGERSLKATYFLMYQGYDRVTNMRPGIGRWAERSFPITGAVEGVAASEAASSCCGGEKAAAPETACCGGGDAPAKSGSCCGEAASDKAGACC